jgi:tRNA-specific 2-thiouridylase
MRGFSDHLNAPIARGHAPADAAVGAAGGAACGDLLRISVRIDGDRVTDAGFDARGCGAAIAAGSAAVALVHGATLLDAARVSADAISGELGGLSPAKRHAAELAADALHRALGAAAAEQASHDRVDGRTLVAMSGGVDSAVAALRCAENGGEVAAVTVELWADPEHDAERSCCSPAAVRSARTLAHRLGLPHFTLDVRSAFRAGVVDPFIAAHAAGETPNPCVTCNGTVRLDAMVALADRLGAAALATGHYARIIDDGAGPMLRAAVDDNKDQSYMLAAVTPETLARLCFPLGELTKPEVRELAVEADLSVAKKPDSQDLCFLAGVDRGRFLSRHGGLEPGSGEIIDADGVVLGTHDGHLRFTVGQRKGLRHGGHEPLFVLATDAATNRVVAGPHAALRRDRVKLRGATLHRDGGRVDAVRLRYRSEPLRARLDGAPGAGEHDELDALLDEPAYGVAPGQIAVLLDGDLVVGHATIARSEPAHRRPYTAST